MFYLFLLLLLSCSSSFSYGFDCMNEFGKPVDYWIAIKKPQGTSYFYYESDYKVFNTSPYSLNDTFTGALAYTTQQLWLKDANYAIDNSAKYGHTKGYFAFDATNNGFLLTHSLPLFPIGPSDTSNYLGIGSNAWIYAQHLLCTSVTATTLNDMAGQFLLNRPQIYDAKLYKDNYKSYENIKNLIDGQYSTLKACHVMPFISSSGVPFTLFSKTAEWNNDLYSECVTEYEKDTLLVETWIRGSAVGPVCPMSGYDTLDIKFLNFITSSWSETQDHSKWAITATKKTICMGDVNRMTTQYSRGGGTVCFVDTILHTVFKTAIIKENSCLVSSIY